MKKPLVILVTGCSSGIGLEVAKEIARKKQYVLFATARAESLTTLRDRLSAHYDDCRVFLRPLDVTNENERKALIEEIAWGFGGVDILINNAGIAYRAVVE